MVSFWSLVSGIFWFSLFLGFIYLLHFNTPLLGRYGVALFLVATFLGAFRILFPLDSKAAIVIRSPDTLPLVWHFLLAPIWEGVAPLHLLLILWAAGAVADAAREIKATYKFSELLRLCRKPLTPQMREVVASLNLEGRQIWISTAISSPISLGLLHPCIYLPDMPVSNADLRWVLLHEECHISHKDSWVKSLFILLRCLLWWDFPVRIFGKVLDDILEVRCDSSVLAGVPAREYQNYLAAIVRMAERSSDLRASIPAAAVKFAGIKRKENILLTRATAIQSLSKRTWRQRLVVWLGSLLYLLVFLGSYCFIVQPYFDYEEITEGTKIDISPETCYIIHDSEGQYTLWYQDICMGELPDEVLNQPPNNQLQIREGTD